jgi:hypothetical protein
MGSGREGSLQVNADLGESGRGISERDGFTGRGSDDHEHGV